MQQETQSTLAVIYENWRGYQEKLRNCVAPLTDEQLTRQPAAHMWPLGQILQHIISVRAGWFSGTLQDADATMVEYMEHWGQRNSPAHNWRNSVEKFRRALAMHDHMQEAKVTEATREALQRFNEAFARHDVDAVMAAMTEDCLFENTYPPPDGERYMGQAAVRAFWEQFFSASPNANFTTEDTFVCNDRAVVCWRYQWIEQDGTAGHVRGVDVFRIRDGKVAEKLSYVKG